MLGEKQRPYKLAVASGTAVPCPDGWTKLNETLTHKLHYDKLDFILKSFFLKLLFKGIFSKLIYVLFFSPFLYGWKLSSVVEPFAPKPKVVGSNPQHSFNFFLCFYFFFLFFKYLDILLQKYIKIHMIFDLHELQHFSLISINVFSHFFKNFVFDVRVIFQTYIKTYGKNIFEIWEISDRF